MASAFKEQPNVTSSRKSGLPGSGGCHSPELSYPPYRPDHSTDWPLPAAFPPGVFVLSLHGVRGRGLLLSGRKDSRRATANHKGLGDKMQSGQPIVGDHVVCLLAVSEGQSYFTPPATGGARHRPGAREVVRNRNPPKTDS